MDYVLGALCLASFVLNYLVYKKVTATHVVGSLEEFEFTPVNCCQCKVEEQQELETAVENPPTKDPASYSAWKNQKGIPWSPPVKPPEPIIKTPNRGPLARPDGFI